MKSWKTFSQYLTFLWICFEVYQKPRSKLLTHGLLAQRFLKSKFFNKYKTIFVTKASKPWNSKTFLPILEFPITSFGALSKAEIDSNEPSNIDSISLDQNKFGRQTQSNFPVKAMQTFDSPNNFSRYWTLLQFCFEVYQKR